MKTRVMQNEPGLAAAYEDRAEAPAEGEAAEESRGPDGQLDRPPPEEDGRDATGARTKQLEQPPA